MIENPLKLGELVRSVELEEAGGHHQETIDDPGQANGEGYVGHAGEMTNQEDRGGVAQVPGRAEQTAVRAVDVELTLYRYHLREEGKTLYREKM